MIRRLIWSAALVACAGIYVFAAADRATFILTDGERKSGIVVFHGGQNENLIDGHLNLGVDNGKDMTFPVEQVAVIDFVGGQPSNAELSQLGTRHMLVTRDGTAQQGRFVNMIGGNTLLWENLGGQRQQFAISDVSRVYLNPQSSRIAFNYTAPVAAPGAAPVTQATRGAPATQAARTVTVHVDATQPWTDTGLSVNQGDRVSFQASGQVRVNGREAATPDGSSVTAANRSRQGNRGNGYRDEGYPIPGARVGALVGRIGNSEPFGIGTQTQPLVMPESGYLMLGVNDNNLSDNSGSFAVIVSGAQAARSGRGQQGRERYPR
jgi:uncharacterized Zn-binding protein involved in type VI secretion